MTIKSNGLVRFSVVNTMTVLVALASVPGDTVAAKLAQPDSSKQHIVGVDQPDRANSASHGQAMERNKPALFYAGVKLVNNARYIEAIDVLNRAATVDPEIGDTHALLAACLAYTGRYQDAEHEFALAEKYGNNYKDFDLERGICAGALKHYKQAANCFNKFIADHPDNNMTIAKHALAIVVNDLLAQPSGNYLSSATKRGVEHWNIGAQALRVYIDETTAPDHQSLTVLKESFNQWSKSPSPIRFVFVNSVKKAQIQCSWTDNKIA